MKFIRVGNEERKKLLHDIGFAFLSYFEGVEYACDPIEDISLTTMGIREIDIHWNGAKGKESYIISVQLVRPGLLIGQRGRTISNFKTHLAKYLNINNNAVEIYLYECSNYVHSIIHDKKLKVIDNIIEK